MHLFTSFCQVGLALSTWSKSSVASETIQIIWRCHRPMYQKGKLTTTLLFRHLPFLHPLEEKWRRFEKDECRRGGKGKRSPELDCTERVLQRVDTPRASKKEEHVPLSRFRFEGSQNDVFVFGIEFQSTKLLQTTHAPYSPLG